MLTASRFILVAILAALVLAGKGTAGDDVRRMPAADGPPKEAKAAEIRALVVQLGSKRFREREAAGKALAEIGEPALDALQPALKSADIDVRHRAEELVKTISGRLYGEKFRFLGHKDAVFALAFSADGRRILSAGGVYADQVARVWDAQSGKVLKTFVGHTGWISSAALSPDGKRIVTASRDLTVRLWDVDTGKQLESFAGHLTQITGVAFSADGKRILSGAGHWDRGQAKDNTVRLWDIAAGKEVRRFSGPAGNGVLSVAYSPQGRLALSGSVDGILQVWDVETGKEVHRIATAAVRQVAISPDGKRGLSGNYDNTMRLWDLETGKEIRAFKGHNGCVVSVAFSPDGRRAVSGGFEDRTVRLWDLETGKELLKFEGHTREICAVAISPDGLYALSSGYDTIIILWRLPKPDNRPR
jgi:WD40 repeat protein